MNPQAMMQGARLSYVVIEQEGTVRRNVHKLGSKGVGLVKKNVEEPAGFLVYFPRGHVLRLKTRDDLKHYNLHKAPRIVNLQGLNDPDSPIGRLMYAQDEAARAGAMEDLQQQVVRLAEAKSGRIVVTQDVADLETEDAA